MNTTLTKFDNYEAVVEYFNNSSMFAIKLGLERISSFLNKIGNPQNQVKTIHIAGTNGKGSVLKMLESILTEARLTTGSFTSPHLIDYTERFCLNRQQISKEVFLEYSNKLFELLDKHNENSLTLFEFLTVLAFLYFADNKVDIALIETGMGGNYDATNVIEKPIVSIITHIDFDHTEYLGNTIEEIAFEKAGIIKPGSRVIFNKNINGYSVLSNTARERDCHIFDFEPDSNKHLQECLPLKGKHQQENGQLALQVIELLNKVGYSINSHQIEQGLIKTSYNGRGQYIESKNLLLDGAHNPAGAQALRTLVETEYSSKKITWVIGTLNYKDSAEMLKSLLKPEDQVIFTEINYHKTSKCSDLAETCRKLFPATTIRKEPELKEALKLAKNSSEKDSLTILCGSLYLIGDYFRL